MSKIQTPSILFQYRSPPKISSLLAGLKENAVEVSNEDLFRFYNIEEASGDWLNQLGAYLNIPRPYITVDNAFIMDLSLTDGPDLLDGRAFADDQVYRSYIRGQLLKRNSRFTINDIINLLLYVTGPAKIFVEEAVKTVNIYIGAPLEDQKRIFSLLSSFDRTWFGLPSGVRLGLFEILVLPIEKDFFIMDSSLMDDPNYLMV